MKKLLVFKPSSSIFGGCFLASLLLSSSLSASSSNVSSAWTLNEEAIVGEPSKDEVRVDIVFSQWIVGQTKPCGCSLASYGGFEARERELKRIRSVHPQSIVLDLGNALFPDDIELKKKQKEQTDLKIKKPINEVQESLLLSQNAGLIIEHYKKWKLDAFVLSGLERDQLNFEQTKKIFAKNDSSLKVLSLDERAKSFSQAYFDRAVGKTGVRIIPVGDLDIKNARFSQLEGLLHKEFLNVFVGDSSTKSLDLLGTKLPKKGNWLYLGVSPEFAMYYPYKSENMIQQLGAHRNQNWMLSTLYLNSGSKTFKYKAENWFTFINKKKRAK